MKPRQTLRGLAEHVGFVGELLPGQLAHSTGDLGDELATREYAFGDDFSSGAGRRRADIGDKIADGEINFVPDGRDDWQRRFEDCSCHYFFVEGPEIFQTAAATSEEDKIQSRIGSSRRKEALIHFFC